MSTFTHRLRTAGAGLLAMAVAVVPGCRRSPRERPPRDASRTQPTPVPEQERELPADTPLQLITDPVPDAGPDGPHPPR
jgi:hypothetical protein